MSQPAQVMMIGWEYPPHNSGGLGVACHGLTKALASQKTQIHFTLPYLHTDKVSHMKLLQCSDDSWGAEGLETLYQPPFSVYDTTLETLQVRKSGDLDQYALRTLPRSELETKVGQYAKVVASAGRKMKNKYQVIHAHDWMSFPAGIKLKQKTGKPLITHVHSTEYDRSGLGSGSSYIEHTEYLGINAADKVIAVSHYTKSILVQKYGINPNKVAVVHNGIDPLPFYPDRGRHHFAGKRPLVAFMGRLTLHKGADYFLKVAKKVVEEVPEVLFVVAGSGDMYHELLFQTAREGLSASVLFSGFIRDVQKEKLLNRADVFMMPSISEPFGLVALEAAQRHIPVIISKNTGVSEVMTGSLAIDFWDVDRMAAAVVKLVTDQEFAQQVRDGQLQNLDHLTWDEAAGKVNQLYQQTLAET